jgi:hypothetical protein
LYDCQLSHTGTGGFVLSGLEQQVLEAGVA